MIKEEEEGEKKEGGGEGEIRGKWGGGASSVDTPVEDERQPLFKTSWSRSYTALNFWVPIARLQRPLASRRVKRDWCTA